MALLYTEKSASDDTIKIFDNFYNTKITIPVDQYDVVNSYFKGVCGNMTTANNLTGLLFKVAEETGIDVMDLLANIKGANNKLEMNQQLAYYLNSIKSKYSLYGVAVIPKPVLPVARNVVL